jgi:Fic family protein
MDLRPPATPEILRLLAQLDRYRAAWLAEGIPAEHLQALEREAIRVSLAATARLSGLRVEPGRIDAIVEQGGISGDSCTPAAASEAAQLCGYAAALAYTFPASGPLVTTDEIRRLHTRLLGQPAGPSPWRDAPLHHEAFDGGRATGRVFQTLPPRLIPSQMEDLASWLELELRSGEQHPALVVAVFTLAVLAASPFAQANARTARVLAFHLLRRAGYVHLAYASLDAVLEGRCDRYHEALATSQTRLWVGGGNLVPWIMFFLEVLIEQSRRLDSVVAGDDVAAQVSDLQRSILEAVREHGTVAAGLLMSATGANRNTLKDNLRRLVDRGMLERTGSRRGTRYRLAHGPL